MKLGTLFLCTHGTDRLLLPCRNILLFQFGDYYDVGVSLVSCGEYLSDGGNREARAKVAEKGNARFTSHHAQYFSKHRGKSKL